MTLPRPFLPAVAALLAAAAAVASARAGDFTGVRGKAALGNEGVAGVTVSAYRDYGKGEASEAAARSAPTGPDGSFALALPPGNWLLVGRRDAAGEGGAAGGRLFCFFGGNPVRVDPGRESLVGLNLSRIGGDPPPSAPSGLSGAVFDEDGKPLPGATVYLYESAADGFKGVPGAFARTREDGSFQLRVRKGTFFAIARKRRSGEMFGPTLPGDRFGFYPGNPVVLADGVPRGIRIDAAPRLSQQERLGGAGGPREEIVLRARAVDREGKPVEGVRLLAYRDAAMTGYPAYVSGKSGPDGRIELAVGEAGRFHLLARERLGGPADGEWYGKYAGTADHAAEARAGGAAEPLPIVVEKR
jgi:hypothetical protein